MKPNAEGGFILEGGEMTAAQWAVAAYKPAFCEVVAPDRLQWDNAAAQYELPLDAADSGAVLEAAGIAHAVGSVPRVHRWPIRAMLLESGVLQPSPFDRVRRACGALLRTIDTVD